MLNLGQNFIFPRACQNQFCIHIRVIVCKKPLEKTPNVPDVLQTQPSCKGYSLDMAYNLCKILNWGQKFNSNYSINETMLKIGHLSKAIAFAWAIAFAKYSM